MKLTTWCGSVVDTRDHGLIVIPRVILGWIRCGWTRRAREMRREARDQGN